MIDRWSGRKVVTNSSEKAAKLHIPGSFGVVIAKKAGYVCFQLVIDIPDWAK